VALVDAERERLGAGRAGAPISGYDLISGITGIGAYLLARRHHDRLEPVLAYLVRLTDPVTAHGRVVPGWWTPDRPSVLVDEERYGRGHLNAGVAHGIAGPLALLSLAWRAGVRVAGHRDAAERIARWLLEHRRVDPTDGSGWWPGDVTFDEQVGGRCDEHLADREAWCYGTPGVARTLQLAGLAFDRPHWQRTAVATMAELLARPDLTATDAGLCHGSAGLLWLASRMARDCPDPDLRAGLAVDALVEEVLAWYDPSAPFGFRYTAQHAIVAPDRPGLLEGAAGIALALTGHAAAAPSTGWDTAMLIS
jgi:lantibiotic biosynthesis protein